MHTIFDYVFYFLRYWPIFLFPLKSVLKIENPIRTVPFLRNREDSFAQRLFPQMHAASKELRQIFFDLELKRRTLTENPL